jgi:hypothetical protein
LQGLEGIKRGEFIYMESYPINIKQIFLQRLKKIGVEPNLISGLMKALASFFFLNPNMNLLQVNERLLYLGWIDIELDYHTYQLAIECLDKSRSET